MALVRETKASKHQRWINANTRQVHSEVALINRSAPIKEAAMLDHRIRHTDVLDLVTYIVDNISDYEKVGGSFHRSIGYLKCGAEETALSNIPQHFISNNGNHRESTSSECFARTVTKVQHFLCRKEMLLKKEITPRYRNES